MEKSSNYFSYLKIALIESKMLTVQWPMNIFYLF